MREPLFFGCWDRPGHFLRTRNGSYASRECEWMQMDGRLAPHDPTEREGRATVHYLHGWTALSWWDRSVDKRGRCNAIVWLPGYLSFDAALAAARAAFPRIFARFTYAVVDADVPDGRLRPSQP